VRRCYRARRSGLPAPSLARRKNARTGGQNRHSYSNQRPRAYGKQLDARLLRRVRRYRFLGEQPWTRSIPAARPKACEDVALLFVTRKFCKVGQSGRGDLQHPAIDSGERATCVPSCAIKFSPAQARGRETAGFRKTPEGNPHSVPPPGSTDKELNLKVKRKS